MASEDVVPDEDDQFDTFLRDVFAPYVNVNFLALGLTAAENTAFQAQVSSWGYAWVGFGNAKAAFHGATSDKDLKRGTVTTTVRGFNARFQINPLISPTVLGLLGLRPRKKTRTASPVPSSPPGMQRIDTGTRGILRLFYGDSLTPDSRAKPDGVKFCEIVQAVVAPGGAPPTDPEAMDDLASESRAPYHATYGAGEIGHTAYLALRWVNTTGDKGPWSQIYSAIVPS